MNRIRQELVLAKALAGAAWADGEVADAESEKIRHLCTELQLTPPETAEVEAILARPIGMAETESLACDFLSRASAAERTDLLRRLGDLFLADGKLGETEQSLIASLRAWDRETPEAGTFLTRMRGLIGRTRTAAPSPSAAFEKIASRVRSMPDRGGMTPQQRERAILFGAILYRTAFADGKVDKLEIAQVRALLTTEHGIDPAEAEQILLVINTRAAEDMDRQRLCASFNRVAEMEERLRLLGCLFAVAKADGRIDENEMREIRLVANYLWIDARTFNDVRIGEA